jgi:hypothetical protein
MKINPSNAITFAQGTVSAKTGPAGVEMLAGSSS